MMKKSVSQLNKIAKTLESISVKTAGDSKNVEQIEKKIKELEELWDYYMKNGTKKHLDEIKKKINELSRNLSEESPKE